MDQEPNLPVSGPPPEEAHDPKPSAQPPAAPSLDSPSSARRISRRRIIKYGTLGLAGVGLAAGVVRYGGTFGAYLLHRAAEEVRRRMPAEVFRRDAPQGQLWEQWQQRGWVREARHCLKLGENIQCKLCPNECLLEPEDRGRCRGRVHKDGKLYTMSYGNPCAFHIDPIEKKPLFHFLPGTGVFSIATSGCGFRCLNCQNWDISQRKPEESKDPRGEPLRLDPRTMHSLSMEDIARASMFPEDVVALARYFDCPSIAYTYSEPAVWFEYMYDTSEAARREHLRNVWVTCGYIQPKPLRELCGVIDAANVDLKGFDDQIYEQLNSGKLKPILDTLVALKREGVWFEVTNLIVPTYTDKPEMIRRMCDWLVDRLGPDYPLHFSRFHPAHKLTHLPPTPVDMLEQARQIARKAGLHYVYVGNCPEVPDAETTFCPGCGKPVIERSLYNVEQVRLAEGKCQECGRQIAGVWS